MPIDLESDIRFPQKGDDAPESLLTAMLLALFSWLLIPTLPLWGYFGRVINAGINDAAEPPIFDEWDELTIDGFKLLALLFVYQLVPLFIIVVAVVLGLGLTASGDKAVAGLGALTLFGGTLVGGGLLLVVGYVIPAAVANLVHEDRFAAGFDVGTLIDVLGDRAYIRHWLYAIGLSIGIYVVASVAGMAIWFVFSILSIIPIIGIVFMLVGMLVSSLLWAVVSIYGQIIIMRVWGRGYAEALGLHEPEETAEAKPETSEIESGAAVASGSGEPEVTESPESDVDETPEEESETPSEPESGAAEQAESDEASEYDGTETPDEGSDELNESGESEESMESDESEDAEDSDEKTGSSAN